MPETNQKYQTELALRRSEPYDDVGLTVIISCAIWNGLHKVEYLLSLGTVLSVKLQVTPLSVFPCSKLQK